ncbi:TonB-dependent receptor [Halioxenophilus aromaticivorans]|uniref:TonB-dependent receptor n=1 Tax=Halioxenophilus aromaticivorans TaxID=1306992 RepID=A0AAV3U6J9_9ALTE
MQNLPFKKLSLHTTLLSIICAFPEAYAAEEGMDVVDRTTSGDYIEEVTVTVSVDQREVNLQDVAASITAVGDELMKQANITDATGLNGYVPGLQVNKSGGAERMVSIRGVGSQTPQNFYSQPGVSFHMDGAYITNNIALNMGFLDVEHIEVLRGPQGTAFGAASTGGTLNVISKKPKMGEFSAEVQAGLGNYNYREGQVAVNLPVGENFAIRGVIKDTSHDGYSESNGIDGGYDLDDADNQNARISALWEPTDSLSVLVMGQRYKDHHNAAALKAVDDPNRDERVVSQDFPGKFDMDMDIATAIINWELPFATLKSTSSYQDMDHAQSFDTDRSTAQLFGGYDHVAVWATTAETYMQELSLSSNTDGAFEWVVGAFYLESESGQYVNEYAGTDVSDPTPILSPSTAASDIPANLSYSERSTVDRTSWATFAQGTFNLTDKLSLTAGLRYNDDSFDGLGSTYFAEPNPSSFGAEEVTGKIGIDYHLTEDNMIYAVASRGYKTGGINSGAVNAMVVSTTIEPEIVTTYELGTKNIFLENALTVNASVFYSDYQDMQYIQEDPIPYSGGLGNIPKANIYGMELETKLALMEGMLELGFNATVLEGEFSDEYYALDRRVADAAGAEAIANGTAPYEWSYEWFLARGSATVNTEGNTPANLPEFSSGLNATLYTELGDFGLITSRVEYLYKSDYESRIFNTDVGHVDGYDQFNLFVQYEPFEGNWRAWVTATNLTDEANIVGRFVDPYGSGVVSDEYIPPRQVVANFSIDF